MGAFFRYMDTVGDGTGTKNFNGDYRDPEGSGPEVAYFTASQDRTEVHRMIISIEDTSGMQPNEYGNLGAALTNGIEVKLYDHNDVEQIDLTDGVAIVDNSGWAHLCFDVELKSWGNTPAVDLVVVRWTFARSGAPLKLQTGWYLAVEIGADNLSGLTHHQFMIQGRTY